MCSVNFWHQQDSNTLFKGSIGHVTSSCKWPISAVSSPFPGGGGGGGKGSSQGRKAGQVVEMTDILDDLLGGGPRLKCSYMF